MGRCLGGGWGWHQLRDDGVTEVRITLAPAGHRSGRHSVLTISLKSSQSSPWVKTLWPSAPGVVAAFRGFRHFEDDLTHSNGSPVICAPCRPKSAGCSGDYGSPGSNPSGATTSGARKMTTHLTLQIGLGQTGHHRLRDAISPIPPYHRPRPPPSSPATHGSAAPPRVCTARPDHPTTAGDLLLVAQARPVATSSCSPSRWPSST